jgi:hypothetical protein
MGNEIGKKKNSNLINYLKIIISWRKVRRKKNKSKELAKKINKKW